MAVLLEPIPDGHHRSSSLPVPARYYIKQPRRGRRRKELEGCYQAFCAQRLQVEGARPQALVFEEHTIWALPGAVARGVQIKIKRTVIADITQEEHQEYGKQRDPRTPLRRDQASPED